MIPGTYKPQIHTHYLPHLSLSFARHTSTLNSTFLLLSSDYSKSLHLQTDRSLEFHTPQGCHYRTRIPRYGRDLKYDKKSAEALVPAVGVNGEGSGEVFRLNLEVGRFMRGYEVEVGGDDLLSVGAGTLQGGVGIGGVNSAAVAEDSHNLLAFGTSLGTVEFWDSRSRGRVGLLSTPVEFNTRAEVTALEFHRAGLELATGLSTGLIYIYDLRSPKPLLKKDQGYGYPIHTLTFLTPSTSSRSQDSEPKMLSADKKIIKIWTTADGAPWTSVEPAVDLNSVTWCKDSGMILTANEGRQQHSFFIPQLGPAPKWCTFLDALVEEMAEDPSDPNAFKSGGEVYDNYKFLTLAQLKALNLDHLIGKTNLLRPYMHGYFVAQRLYEEARLIADPFIWEDERAKRIREKIDKERESRIRGNKSKVKVNRELAEKMLARDEKRRANKHKQRPAEEGEDERQVPEETDGLLNDTRFSALFRDEDFAVDHNSREFQMLNPNKTKEATPRGRTAVEDEEEEMAQGKQLSTDEENDDDDDDDEEPTSPTKRPSTKPSQRPELRISTSTYQKAGHTPHNQHSQTLSSKGSGQQQQRPKWHDRSFASRMTANQTRSSQRAARAGAGRRSSGVVGEKEVTFSVGGYDGNKGGKKNKMGKRDDERPSSSSTFKNAGSSSRRDQGRRSASGNVFRRM